MIDIGGKHPFLILHLHSPSEALELISQKLQKSPSAMNVILWSASGQGQMDRPVALGV